MKNTSKKLISVFISLLVAFTSFSFAFAADASEVLTYKVSSDGYAIVYDCDEDAQGVVSIPSEATIKGEKYTVKFIGQKAFDSCYGITDIIIPEGVTAIKSGAFRNCVSLTDVHIPRTLSVCQYDAFDGCGTVTVHCYRANYQFFTVHGASANLEINILDPVDDEEAADKKEENIDPISRIVEVFKNFIMTLLDYFGVNDDEEDIYMPPFIEDLPFIDDLPFEF